ncbi:hypothetical protein B7R21_06260 [Subtercola boreus]|uniref:Uncharacterized protein n=1 Tax=Subtercola boreus TaxID=120213 RepID=A0A3E0VY73_9MICO|nr:hypothetical protein [Subtercola boreus]RFA14545.1 hypothetical protein B7R21_06260 [Subtercola boreus]
MAYTTVIANLKGPKGDDGDPGPKGLDGVTGATTDAAVAANARNPEAATYSAINDTVVATFNGFSPFGSGKYVVLNNGDSINTARPLTAAGGVWPGPVIWCSKIGRPTNMLAGTDFYFAISTDPLSFSPLVLAGLFAWFSPTNSGVSEGASMSAWTDNSPAAHNAVNWNISSTAATNLPVYSATALNSTPGVRLIVRSGLGASGFTVTSPACVIFGANAQWLDPAPTSVNQHLNSMGNTGSFSISRTPSNTWAASIDGVTYYNFGTADNNPHSFVLVATSSNIQVWVDGNKLLDQAIAFSPLPTVSLLRLGFVGTTSTNTQWKYMGGGVSGGIVGDTFGSTPSAAPSSSDISVYTQWLKARRGA